jgi:translation initiation factor 1
MPKGGWREFGDPPEPAPRQRPETAAPPRAERRVRVQRTRAGKGGKTVTAISGLELGEAEARALLKRLKAACGTGGTVREGGVELQGDHVAAALAELEAQGFRPKRAGG